MMKHLADSPRRIVARAVLVVLLIGWVLSIVAQEPVAQTPNTIDKAELHQALLDLTNAATVMCVAAHPDDEDGTTLTVLRRKYGVHTVTLFSTYGEGGQNVVGPELYEALGVIRANETRAAAQIQGSEPHFLGLKDFGFSKSAEEAFRFWGREEALRRMVYKIRELRPDVIITNHDTTTGHGHHQATGRLVLEAFDAAADAKRFPEQLTRVRVWQPSRLFVRARGLGGNNAAATSANDKFVTIDPNEVDPIRGTMYAEQALAALQKHASQGPWPASIAERLRGNPSGKLPLVRYRLARETAGNVAFPSEGKNFLEGLAIATTHPAPTIDGRALTEIIDQPDRVLNALIDWRRRATATSMTSSDWARRPLMSERANRALTIAAGVTISVSTRSQVLVPGTPATFTVNITNAGNRTVKVDKLTFSAWGEEVELEAAEQMNGDTETSNAVDRVTPANAAYTIRQSEHLYDGRLSGEMFVAKTELEVDGAKFSIAAERSMGVAPAVQIKHVSPIPYVWTSNTSTRPLALRLTLVNSLPTPFRGIVKLRGPQSRPFEVGRAVTLGPHETSELTLQSNALPSVVPQRRRGRENPQLTLSVLRSDSASTVTAQKVPIVLSDARVSAKVTVGYLPSFDTTLEQALDALGVAAKKLAVENIRQDDLAGYDTIIIDNRGYYAHPELIAANSKLLKYVEEGGTLIVFYHKDSEWNPTPERGRPQLAPYPIILGDERVTEEVAAIRFLQPRHPLLNYPNKIRSSDFMNWIQERGLYYPKEWDEHYTPLFESNDTGEKPLRGGLLVARYGAGNYIYTSLVWYRQLAAGVPGAYRMLANMISYGK
jgi:LmbE family N-acetylglucosaminyl deacetylase